jgi:ribosomal protein S18 acetylase RimI-like enzyme
MRPASLSADQLAAAAAVYGRAFLDDPIGAWVMPDETRRARGLPLLFGAAMRYAMRFGGQVHLSDAAPRGVATWLEPGRSPPATLGMLRSGLASLLWRLGPAIGRFVTFADTFDRLHRQDMREPHWYLWLLAVDPPHQGKGLAGQLIRPTLREADVSRLPCYLETAKESNVSLYMRFGFRVLREEALGRDGPRFWTMLRKPEVGAEW